ncbi:MAG TPA: hypothetical protein VFT19_11255 [Solirubrobacterales bacterium]|nr:hypothetical protein [Solirubrobacterales bacterium]
MLQLSSVKLISRLGLASPWCLSSSCHYLEEGDFHRDATDAIAGATPTQRLYCFERSSGKVAAALHWRPDEEHHRLHAIALRGGATGPIGGATTEHVHAAGIFALGVVQYRARAVGGSGAMIAGDDVAGGWGADLKALGFTPRAEGWRLAPAASGSRLSAHAALARIRLTTRR